MGSLHDQHLIASFPFSYEMETRGLEVGIHKIGIFSGGFHFALGHLLAKLRGVDLSLCVLGEMIMIWTCLSLGKFLAKSFWICVLIRLGLGISN